MERVIRTNRARMWCVCACGVGWGRRVQVDVVVEKVGEKRKGEYVMVDGGWGWERAGEVMKLRIVEGGGLMKRKMGKWEKNKSNT